MVQTRVKGHRQKYQKFLGANIPKSFDVHHIDLNPLNNTIPNLVAIPRKLHVEYHKVLNKIQENKEFLESFDDYGSKILRQIVLEEGFYSLELKKQAILMSSQNLLFSEIIRFKNSQNSLEDLMFF
jgi:hypothetical protein